MAITSGLVAVNISASQSATVGIATTLYRPQVNVSRTYANGTTAPGQADLIGSFRATMTTGTPLSVDLRSGQLVDGQSAAINPARAVAFALFAREANSANITVTTSGAGGWQAAINGAIVLPPGGVMVVSAPAGYAITSGTGDLLSCAGTTGDVLDICVLGRSA